MFVTNDRPITVKPHFIEFYGTWCLLLRTPPCRFAVTARRLRQSTQRRGLKLSARPYSGIGASGASAARAGRWPCEWVRTPIGASVQWRAAWVSLPRDYNRDPIFDP